ncbi:hypothetical protein [Sorangium sp. So ce1097]|uniref:hypothetical protein n=1 Tax=Sorangium sp. So ce1097 TaxID=3133330 RepID=UPI003F5F82AD
MHDLSNVISELVRQLCAGEIEDRFHLRTWAKEHAALPVMADLGGCFALTCGAQIVSFGWDEQDDVRPEDDPRIRRIACFRAALLYPVLKPLVPPRPADAVDCSYCAGTGRVRDVPAELAESLVCYCGGLGWLLRGEDTA